MNNFLTSYRSTCISLTQYSQGSQFDYDDMRSIYVLCILDAHCFVFFITQNYYTTIVNCHKITILNYYSTIVSCHQITILNFILFSRLLVLQICNYQSIFFLFPMIFDPDHLESTILKIAKYL